MNMNYLEQNLKDLGLAIDNGQEFEPYSAEDETFQEQKDQQPIRFMIDQGLKQR